jgi:hypothetical protein
LVVVGGHLWAARDVFLLPDASRATSGTLHIAGSLGPSAASILGWGRNFFLRIQLKQVTANLFDFSSINSTASFHESSQFTPAKSIRYLIFKVLYSNVIFMY